MKERIIGNYTSNIKGPLIFVTAGVHGNEPSGVKALEKVFRELKNTKPEIKGRIIGLKGNVAALKKGQRYIDEDLNRTWKEDDIKNERKDSQEQKEMFEIIDILEQYPE